jgi:hypothetical protein
MGRQARCSRCGQPFALAPLTTPAPVAHPRPQRPQADRDTGGSAAQKTADDGDSEPGFFTGLEKFAKAESVAQGSGRLVECPFCAENIEADARKCPFCGEVTDASALLAPGAPMLGRSASKPLAQIRRREERAGVEFPWGEWVIALAIWGVIAYKTLKYGLPAMFSWSGFIAFGIGAAAAWDPVRRTVKYLTR